MSTITLKKASGLPFNYFDMPAVLLNNTYGIANNSDPRHEMKLTMRDITQMFAFIMAFRNLYPNIEITNAVGNIISPTFTERDFTDHIVINMDRVLTNEANRPAETGAGNAPVEPDRIRCNECGEISENCECERCTVCGALVDNCICQTCVNINQNAIYQYIAETDEKKIEAQIAACAFNQTTSDARGRSDLINKYNSMLSEMMLTQRKIYDLDVKIASDRYIKSIMSGIAKVRENPGLVNEIFISENKLIIKTHEIITNLSITSTHKRYRIGKMMFVIPLQFLLIPNSSGNTHGNINIINLDRNARLSGVYYSCGHAKPTQACFGGWTEQIIKACSSLDIPALTEILIRFVANPDLNDPWGVAAKYFPEVTE